MKKVFNYSPNFNSNKRKSKQIEFLIFHYTGMRKESDAINRLTNIQSEVSSHYLIQRNGTINVMVPDLYVAWHAGKSSWKSFKSLNKNSIGIEISNPGHENKYINFSKKQIQSIKTNSTPLDETKDWKVCNLFNIYKLLASKEEIDIMKNNYETGGYGFGHAKKELIDLILNKFKEERKKFNYYILNPNEVESILKAGSYRAKITADIVLERVRKKLGY